MIGSSPIEVLTELQRINAGADHLTGEMRVRQMARDYAPVASHVAKLLDVRHSFQVTDPLLLLDDDPEQGIHFGSVLGFEATLDRCTVFGRTESGINLHLAFRNASLAGSSTDQLPAGVLMADVNLITGLRFATSVAETAAREQSPRPRWLRGIISYEPDTI